MTHEDAQDKLYQLFVVDLSTLFCFALLIDHLGWEPWYVLPSGVELMILSVALWFNVTSRFVRWYKGLTEKEK